MTETAPFAWRRWLPLILLACAAGLGFWLLGDRLSFDTLRDNRAALLARRDAAPVLTAALFVAAYAGVVALSLPGAALATLTGGFLFGLFPGAFLNVTGATLGALIIFSIVRLGFGERFRAWAQTDDGAVGRVSTGIRENEVPVLLTMRLLPVIPFFVANLIPAFLGVATWRFVWTTALGILPGGLVYTWVGAGLGEVFERGETPDMGIVFQPQILGPLLALAALSLVPVAMKLMQRGRA